MRSLHAFQGQGHAAGGAGLEGSPAVEMPRAQRKASFPAHVPEEISCSVFKAGRLDFMQLKPREAVTAFLTLKSDVKKDCMRCLFLDSRLENEVRGGVEVRTQPGRLKLDSQTGTEGCTDFRVCGVFSRGLAGP